MTSIGSAAKHQHRKYTTSSVCNAAVWPPIAIKCGAAGTMRRNSSPAMMAKCIPCQTAGPTRSGRPAPVYCATKVDT